MRNNARMVAVQEAVIDPRRQSPGNKGNRISILTQQKVQNLYLFRELSNPEIAQETGLTVMAVSKLVSRLGLPAIKRRKMATLSKTLDARMAANAAQVAEAIASQCEEHALSAVDRVGDALRRTDANAARDSQSYSATVKNLVGVVQSIRAPASELANGERGSSLNLFFLAPVIAEPKLVQEVDAKKVADYET